MELNKFLTKVLVEITTGVKNANAQIGEGTFEMEPFRRYKETGFIAFDLAVKTSEEHGKDAKGGIQILNIGVGGTLQKSSIQESANRVELNILA